ncbi:alpha-L-glutamate ligase [Streptomyces sp. NPDC001941]|uniref:ATP-grasp domain-containing protein n=1 Tax=Streptomyces sp. NPDC001941 TaxID=3154659 RepID=UPI00332D6416
MSGTHPGAAVVGVVTPDPDHPLLADTARLLTGAGHEVRWLRPDAPAPARTCDVYLLKSRTPRGLALARELERRGAPVVNSASATARCQDRVALADLARGAGIPYAPTLAVTTPARLARRPWGGRPLVLKSRYSRRGDLVALAEDGAALAGSAARWPDEPVVVQEFAPNDGWDHKLWVVAGRVFAARRRSELAPGGKGEDVPLATEDLPPGWSALLLRVGEVFALEVYGVDVIATADGAPLVVDVNAFPGIRGQAGAPRALADLALTRAAGVRA